MAKKKTNSKKSTQLQIDERLLPQNIVSIGEHVEENKNIYILQSVYKTIHKFTKGKTTNESGGMLIGYVVEDFGKTNIIITGFVEAKFCEATPTTLKFTHETWEYCHKEIAKKYPKQKKIGWIHTHPDFGIFLSEYDKFIQSNFFKEEYQIAYVVDPVQNIEGFYFWINGNIERCKGFYIFDKTGVKISIIDEECKVENVDVKNDGFFSFKNIIIILLTISVIILSFSAISLKGKVDTLENNQKILDRNINEGLSYFQRQILNLKSQIADVNENIKLTSEDTNTTDDNGDNATIGIATESDGEH